MIYENATVKYWYRYSHHVAERFGLPLAQMTVKYMKLFNSDGFDLYDTNRDRVQWAEKVWRQVNDEPILIVKSRDYDMKFDEDEFTRMLFVADQIDYIRWE